MAITFHLTMLKGPTPGKIFALEGASATIGRESSAEIVINDPEISRQHTRLTFDKSAWEIEDLGSTNGTFVNDDRLNVKYILQSEDIISLGEKISLRFESSGEEDVSATVVAALPKISRPKTTPVRPAPAMPKPVEEMDFAGQIPEGPLEPESGFSVSKGVLFIVLGIFLLCLLCGLGGLLWYIDANYLWCNFFPWLFGAACA